MIDVSTSGHVRKNELPLQAVLREAFEEIGVIPTTLYPKIQDLMQTEMDFSKIGRKGRYIIKHYLACLEYPIEYYTKQDEEVEELFFMDYEILKDEIRHQKPNMRIPYIDKTEKLFSIIDENLQELNNKENQNIEK